MEEAQRSARGPESWQSQNLGWEAAANILRKEVIITQTPTGGTELEAGGERLSWLLPEKLCRDSAKVQGVGAGVAALGRRHFCKPAAPLLCCSKLLLLSC